MKRIDTIIVQFVATEYDAEGRPVNEAVTQLAKFFAAKLEDLQAKLAEFNAQLAKDSNG